MHSMHEIEKLTLSYSAHRSKLTEEVSEVNAAIEAIKRTHISQIKKLVGKCAEAYAALKSAIEGTPENWEKPRTVVFHGIKVGMQKAVGHLEYEDDEQICRLIRKKFPDLADTLIVVKETPNLKAIEQLKITELKSLGIEVVEAGDRPVIRPVDTAVDKVVKALLKDAQDAAEEGRG